MYSTKARSKRQQRSGRRARISIYCAGCGEHIPQEQRKPGKHHCDKCMCANLRAAGEKKRNKETKGKKLSPWFTSAKDKRNIKLGAISIWKCRVFDGVSATPKPVSKKPKTVLRKKTPEGEGP